MLVFNDQCKLIIQQVADLDKLNIIHVAGTKGKGSVCAMAESILRTHGYKTGFFSSPHLVNVRERIRISGQLITEKAFCDHFWRVHDDLTASVRVSRFILPVMWDIYSK